MGGKILRNNNTQRRDFRRRGSVLVVALSLAAFGTGCKKKTPIAAAPPAPAPTTAPVPVPAPARPTITRFEAEPTTIERGQASTLRWAVSGQATSVNLSPGIGLVAESGTRQVYPSNTTTYLLKVEGTGGAPVERTVTVNVSTPAAAPTQPALPPRSISEILADDVKDAYFDYDRSDIREDARAILTRNADILKQLFTQYPGTRIIVEGHADERGSAEYNLGLSDRRSKASIDFLVQLGVPGDRLNGVSFGRERPQCTDATESCYQSNRRAHFTAGQ